MSLINKLRRNLNSTYVKIHEARDVVRRYEFRISSNLYLSNAEKFSIEEKLTNAYEIVSSLEEEAEILATSIEKEKSKIFWELGD